MHAMLGDLTLLSLGLTLPRVRDACFMAGDATLWTIAGQDGPDGRCVMTAILRTEEVVVRFGVLQAVSQASIEVIEGRVTGLIGPNGAGKTTLFNVITGLQEPTSGKVFFEGKDITNKNPFKRARMGIARTFQKLEVFGSLSARENILVAAEQRKTWEDRKSTRLNSSHS